MIEEAKAKSHGGLIGFVKGTQSLGKAFWLVGVLPALIIAGILLLVKDIAKLDFASLMLLTFCLTMPARLFSWLSIVRCIKNTTSSIWSVLAGLIVAFDILHKLIFWPMVWVGYQDSQHRKAQIIEHVELCKTEVSRVTGRPTSDLTAQNFKSYSSDEEPYYLIYFIDKKVQYYKCWVDDESIRVEKR